MTQTCCLDCLASCYVTNCRDSTKPNDKYAGWCSGSDADKENCSGACVYFVEKVT